MLGQPADRNTKPVSFPWYHADYIRKQSLGVPYRAWLNSVANNGMIRFRVLWNQERLFLTSPEALKEVLVTKVYEFDGPQQGMYVFRKIIGNGLLVSSGAEHARQRKALMPAFGFRHVKDLYPVFWSKAKQVTAAMAAENKRSKSQSAKDWASRATLDIIGLAGMGHDFNSIADPNTEICKTYAELFENEPPFFKWFSIGLYLPFEYFWNLPLPLLNVLRKSAQTVKNIGYEQIRRKHALIASKQHPGNDILSIAMDSGQFTDDDLANQLMTFLAAGHETTASALTWATYLLCKHPDVQARLRKEVRAALPSPLDPDSQVTALQVDKVSYLSAVCNETLRLMSSVPMTMRDALVDTSICGQRIPKHTRVIIPAWAVNTSFELWGPDALDFNPDRWMGEGRANTGGAKSNYAFLTFLHGSHSCIGKDFAKSEFMCLLAAWAGRFEMSLANPDQEPEIVGWVTIKPKDGLPVVFKEVGGW